MRSYRTEQETFWAGEFGEKYVDNNPEQEFLASRTALFSRVIEHTRGIQSVIEFGSNIGSNLTTLGRLLPDVELSAIEINTKAVSVLKNKRIKVYHQSILDFKPEYQRDFVFTSGLLIHIQPQILPEVYELLFRTSRKYIFLLEYYNTTPVEIEYRGHRNKLFKRDFAGEILDRFPALQLIDYGFVYHRDNNFPLDDNTWFLLEKR